MKRLCVLLIMLAGLTAAGENPAAPPGYTNAYTAHIKNTVLSPLNLQGQYLKAYAECDDRLKQLSGDTQSIQVLVCWNNMRYALNGLNRSDELKPLRDAILAKFKHNIPFLAALNMKSVPPYGYWQDHQFHRGDPPDQSIPLFSCYRADRAEILSILLDPEVLRLADRAKDAELRGHFFHNLQTVLRSGSPTREEQRKAAEFFQRYPASIQPIPAPDHPEKADCPPGMDLYTILYSLFANDGKYSPRDLKAHRIPDGSYGFMSDLTESGDHLLTAWACEALLHLYQDPARKSQVDLHVESIRYLTRKLAEDHGEQKGLDDVSSFMASVAARAGHPAAAMRMFENRSKLSLFGKIQLARALPEGIEETRILRHELKNVKPETPESLAVYCLYLRERDPRNARLAAVEKSLRAQPPSLWKARALAGERFAIPENQPEIRQEIRGNTLILHAAKPLRFVKVRPRKTLRPPEQGFWLTEKGYAVHCGIESGIPVMYFCDLPAGETRIPITF